MAGYCTQCGKQLGRVFGRGLDYRSARNHQWLRQILEELSLLYHLYGHPEPSEPFRFAPDKSPPDSWRWCGCDCAAQWLNECLSRKRAQEAAERRSQDRKRGARRELLLKRVRALGYVASLHPLHFERFVLNVFRAQGWNAEPTRLSGDQGIDGYLQRGDRRAAVQCKRLRAAVGEPAVRDFVGALDGRGIREGFFVTSSEFTPTAYAYATRIGDRLHLIDGPGLTALVDRYLTSKFVLSEEYVDLEVPGQVRTTGPTGHRKSPHGWVDRVLNIPRCVKCGERMQLLEKERQVFWGCSRFPQCRSYRRATDEHLEWVTLGLIEPRRVGAWHP